jgi:hypothetical protein
VEGRVAEIIIELGCNEWLLETQCGTKGSQRYELGEFDEFDKTGLSGR